MEVVVVTGGGCKGDRVGMVVVVLVVQVGDDIG